MEPKTITLKTTTRAAKAMALAAARKRWGKTIELRENREHSTPASRAATIATITAIQRERTDLQRQIDAAGDFNATLYRACLALAENPTDARPAFRAALDAATAARGLIARLADANIRFRAARQYMPERWQAIDRYGPMCTIYAGADTLEELIARAEKRD